MRASCPKGFVRPALLRGVLSGPICVRDEGSKSAVHMGRSAGLSTQSLSPRALGRPAWLLNPPYPSRGRSSSTVFPFSYEDLVALDGGDEGMDVITHILTLAPRLLNASGYGHQPPPTPLSNRQSLAVIVHTPLAGHTTWK